MPKLKTHTGAKKRFKLTKNGKVKRAHAFKRHLLNNGRKTTKRNLLQKGSSPDSSSLPPLPQRTQP